MVGRAAELDRLAGLIASPTPTIALVSGEAGIGKTRLVQELVSRLPGNTLVLSGQADPEARARPLALFADALCGLTGSSGSGNGDTDHADLTATVLDPDRSVDDRVQAAVHLVRALDSPGRPTVVVFEDLHWADPESLTIFERLAEPDSGAQLLVGTYRPDGLSRRHPASELLPRLERRHSVTHIHLDRLEPTDVGIFLNAVFDAPPSYRVVTALHARTGGNPFFLEELIATSPSVPSDELCDMPLPWTVSELVRAQLDELEPDVRRIVATASELGRRVPFDVLAAVSATSEDDLIDLLRRAVDSGLLLEIEPDVFGFHHEIAREAIKGGLLGRERRRLHQAAFDALRAAGSRDHSAMARHAQGAGLFEDMVHEARLGSHSLLNHGSSYQALQLAECGLSEAEDDVELLHVAARSAWLTGLVEDAVEYNERWLREARSRDDVSEEAAALSLQFRLAYEMGDTDAMTRYSDDLVDVVDRLPTDDQRAQAMAALAQSYMLRDQVGQTVVWADKARELADANHLTSVRLAAMVEKGSALIHDIDTVDEARALLEEAIAEADDVGEHFLAARALNNLVWHAIGADEAGEVRKLIDRQQLHAKAAGWLTGSGHSEATAQMAAIEGDIDAAIALLDRSEIPVSNQTGWKKRRWTAVLRAGFALEVGDLEAAARWRTEASPTSPRMAPGVVGLDFNLACRLGRLDDARARLAELLEAVAAEDFASPNQVHDVSAAALRAGLTPAELRPLAAMAGSSAGRRLPSDDPWRRLIEAQLAEAEGRLEDAATLYQQAAATMTEALPPPLAGARGSVHVGAARCLVALGRLDEARTHARAAAVALARWRGWRVDELRAVERRLGLGAEPAGPAVLTPREREVVQLVAEGLTNSQLADRLYISPRTAAVHVSNVLAKLDMSSRTEIAAWAARGGLDS
jgi:DNA-binding CsgD family transcriptional regulator